MYSIIHVKIGNCIHLLHIYYGAMKRLIYMYTIANISTVSIVFNFIVETILVCLYCQLFTMSIAIGIQLYLFIQGGY
jgi:hypothetical protein